MAAAIATSTTSSPPSPVRRDTAAFWILLTAICVASVALPGSPLLGEWESQTVYAVFGAQSNPLNLTVAPAANIGGQGYLLLDISRTLIEKFHIPYTIDLIRLPTKLLGAAGLVAFSVVARRWFGVWPAVAATALLAVNPIYHQYQNELIIAGPSLVALIILLERLQFLSRKPLSWPGWLTMALVWTVMLTMYGPARIFGTILVALWLPLISIRTLRRTSGLTIGGLVARASTFCAIPPVALALADTANAQYFNRTILFPRVAESTLVNGSFEDAIAAMPINARVVAESLLLGGGSQHSTFVEATLIQGRYPTVPPLIVPLVVVGLAVALWLAWTNRRHGVNKYLVIIGLAALTTIPLLSSSVLEGEAGPLPTLVNHRLVFFLIPAYLSLAALGAFIGNSNRWWRLAGSLVVVSSVLVAVIQILVGHSNFVAREAATDPRLTGVAGQFQWLEGSQFSAETTIQGSHFQQHEQYRRWAAATAMALESAKADGVLIVPTSIACFPEAQLSTHTLGELRDKNYHSIFLSMYLADALGGEPVGYINVPPSPDPLGWVMYKSAVYSGQLSVGGNGTIDYVRPDLELSRVMAFGSTDPRVILTTTPTELEAATSLLEGQGHPYQVLGTPLPCWAAI